MSLCDTRHLKAHKLSSLIPNFLLKMPRLWWYCVVGSYDARSGQFWRQGSSRTRDPRYEGRVALNVTAHQKVFLNLNRVTRNDTGRFTCRVDFLGSPSLNSDIILKVYGKWFFVLFFYFHSCIGVAQNYPELLGNK